MPQGSDQAAEDVEDTMAQDRTPLEYDQIAVGDRVIVTSRKDILAEVEDKFRSQSDSPSAPAGTEYIQLKRVGQSGRCLNYPHQLIRAEGRG